MHVMLVLLLAQTLEAAEEMMSTSNVCNVKHIVSQSEMYDVALS